MENLNTVFERIDVNLDSERDLITNMILYTDFLEKISYIIDTKHLKSDLSKTIANWCLDYFKRYKKAPQKNIESIFKLRYHELKNPERVELIAQYLDNLSKNYLESKKNLDDVPFYLDQAEKYLRIRALEVMRDEIYDLISNDLYKEAEKKIENFTVKKIFDSKDIDVIDNREAIISAMLEYEDGNSDLFSYPGALGKVLKGGLVRGDLFAITAPMKRGKTWWLIDLALRALTSRLNVLFVSLVMTQSQVIRRIYQGMLGAPLKNSTVDIPFFNETGNVNHKTTQKNGLDLNTMLSKNESIKTLLGGKRLRLLCCPAYSTSASELKTYIKNMKKINFIPDVIIVDYADILAPEKDNQYNNYRHSLDSTWKILRAMAQEFDALVATASQSVRATLGRDVNQEDIAEDIRKLAHVGCMFAINQDAEEKELGLARIKILAQRHGAFSTKNEIIVLQCLEIGKPTIQSEFSQDIEYTHKIKKKNEKF